MYCCAAAVYWTYAVSHCTVDDVGAACTALRSVLLLQGRRSGLHPTRPNKLLPVFLLPCEHTHPTLPTQAEHRSLLRVLHHQTTLNSELTVPINWFNKKGVCKQEDHLTYTNHHEDGTYASTEHLLANNQQPAIWCPKANRSRRSQ